MKGVNLESNADKRLLPVNSVHRMVQKIFNDNSIPELSSDLRTSDFLKVYPMKFVSLDVNICNIKQESKINHV